MLTKLLGPAQRALARYHSYLFLSQLYLKGVTAELVPTIQIIPELAVALVDPFDPDEAAADHYQLFGFNVFPYATIFLDGDGLLGGRVTNDMLTSHHHLGYWMNMAATSSDHIGHELELLAFLSQAEAEAWEENQVATTHRLRQWQREFLQTHLLRWLLPFVTAVQHHDNPFYVALAELTLDLIYEQYTNLAEDLSTPPAYFSLLPAPALLSDEKTGLREIANFLITPVYSGFYLSRHQIGQLASQHQLPCGFGSRQQMLLNELHSAVTYNSLLTLCTALAAILTNWQVIYQDYAVKFPKLAPFAAVWSRRAEHTTQLLAEIKQRAG